MEDNTAYWDQPYPRYVEVPANYWTSTNEVEYVDGDSGAKDE